MAYSDLPEGFSVVDKPPEKPAAKPVAQEESFGDVPAGFQVKSTPKPGEVSSLEAAGRGVKSGALMGFGDEVSGASAAGVAGLPPEAARAVARSPIASGLAALGGGIRMGAEYLFPETFGAGNKLSNLVTGEKPVGPATKAYTETRDAERDANEAAQRDHPYIYGGAQFGGSLVGPGAAYKKGAGLLYNMGRMGGVSGLQGGVSGAGEAEEMSDVPWETGKGALFGFGIGAGLPLVGKAAMVTGRAAKRAGAGARDFVQAQTESGARKVAERRVDDTIARDRADPTFDGLQAEDYDRAQGIGQNVVVGDTGGRRTTGLARAAGNGNDEARAQLRGVTDERWNGQRDRVADHIENDIYGGNLNNAEIETALQQEAQRTNRANYAARDANAADKDLWDDTLHNITQAPSVQDAMRRVEKTAADEAVLEGAQPVRNPFKFNADGTIEWKTGPNGETVAPNIHFWDHVHRNLQTAAKAAQRAGDADEYRRISGIERQMTKHIDTIVPEWETARRGSRLFRDADDALEDGRKFMNQNQQISLDQLTQNWSGMSQPEQELFRRGVMSELVGKLRNKRNSEDATLLFEGPARRKLQAILPPDQLNQIEGMVRTERIMNRLRTAVSGGSRTSEMVMDGLAGGLGTAAGALNGLDPTSMSAGAIVSMLGRRGVARGNRLVMGHVGDILSSNDPQRIRAILGGPEGPQVMNALRQIDTGLGNAAGREAPQLANENEPRALTIRPDKKRDGFAEGGVVKGQQGDQEQFMRDLIDQVAERMRGGAPEQNYAGGGAVVKGIESALEALAGKSSVKGVLKRGDSARMTELPSLRDLPVDEATEIAKRDPHLIKSGDQSEGYFVGSPREIGSKRALTNKRNEVDAYVAADPRGGDWYDRYRNGMNEVTGGDPEANKWMSAQEGQWSAGVDPGSELGFATKENNAAIAGMPVKAARPAQHEAHMRAIENQDPGEYQLGKKTGEYARKVNADQDGAPGATGVNDFRYARTWGYTEPDGSPQKGALTDAAHTFIDYETANAVRRANEAGLGGRNDWTGEQFQAAPWVRQKALDIMEQRNLVQRHLAELQKGKGNLGHNGGPPMEDGPLGQLAEQRAYDEAFAEANKTIADHFPKHEAHATYEDIPGANTGHLPGATLAPLAEREAYSADPRSSWATAPGGRDAIYSGLGVPGTGVKMRVRPSQEMQGFYTNDAGRLETNPGGVARPLVGIDAGDPRQIAKADRALMEAAEHARAFFDAQEAGAAHKVFPAEKAGQSNSYFIPMDRKATIDEMKAVRDATSPHGLGDVVDRGDGITATQFYGGPPKFDRDGRKAVEGALAQTGVGKGAQRAYVDSIYEPIDWSRGQGSGAATRDLLAKVSQTPEMFRAFDSNPYMAQNVLNKMERDADYAGQWGATREDIQNARRIFGEGGGPGGFTRLKKALESGALLPAIGAAILSAAQAPSAPPSGGGLSALQGRAEL